MPDASLSEVTKNVWKSKILEGSFNYELMRVCLGLISFLCICIVINKEHNFSVSFCWTVLI